MDLHRGPDPGTSAEASSVEVSSIVEPCQQFTCVSSLCVLECVERASSTSEHHKSAVIRNGTTCDDEASAPLPPSDSNFLNLSVVLTRSSSRDRICHGQT